MNDAQPFFPPIEPEQLQEAAKGAAKRIHKAKQKAFEVMFKMTSGFWELPPRQRRAIYKAHEPILPWLRAIETINGEQAAKMARDYRTLIREEERKNGASMPVVPNVARPVY
jgi:hypothetical protein